MRLSLALGIPVRELQNRMSSQEFTEYLAYFSVEPWAEERADLNSAMIAALLANAYRNPKAKPQPFTLQDFKIDWWKQTKAPVQQSVQRMKTEMEFLGKVLGTKQIQGA